MLGLRMFDERADRTVHAEHIDPVRANTDCACAKTERLEPRFAALLAPSDWARLPSVVRRRFATAPRPGEARTYVGAVTETRLSTAGWTLAQVARAFGNPLPFARDIVGPATVTVTESPDIGGQIWTRTYSRKHGFPQTINSAKRFAGPTGLEEYLGFGLIMRLRLLVDTARDLVFVSEGYAWSVCGWRIPVPGWIAPGQCKIRHRDLGQGRFAFILTLKHPFFGELVHQRAEFREAVPVGLKARAALPSTRDLVSSGTAQRLPAAAETALA